MLGVWLNAADALVTATIMPSVARDLGGAAYYGWAVAFYLTGSILAGASTGQLSHRLGLRPAMILAALAYAAGCALSAASPTIEAFLLGRILQGIGAGWLVGFCYVAIGVVFPEALWARMFGATAGVWGIASILGPLVGGLFASAGFWRGAFWLFAGQGVLFALACVALLPGRRPDNADVRPLAWRTLSILAIAILLIAAADVIGGVLAPLVLLTIGVVLLGVALWVNAWPGERLLPPEAAWPASIAGAGYAMIFAMEVATVVITVYEAAILQSVYRVSPLVAGYAVSVIAVGWTTAAMLVSNQPERRHGALIVSGGAGHPRRLHPDVGGYRPLAPRLDHRGRGDHRRRLRPVVVARHRPYPARPAAGGSRHRLGRGPHDAAHRRRRRRGRGRRRRQSPRPRPGLHPRSRPRRRALAVWSVRSGGRARVAGCRATGAWRAGGA